MAEKGKPDPLSSKGAPPRGLPFESNTTALAGNMGPRFAARAAPPELIQPPSRPLPDRAETIEAANGGTEDKDTDLAVEFSSAEDDRSLESKFELLQARVLALEIALKAVRESPLPGIGHNQGPTEFDSDLAETDHLIALLKQQHTPFEIANRQELVEAAQRTSRFAEKIKEYADDVCKEAAKSFGSQSGKQLALVLWLSLAAALTFVGKALLTWLQAVPN
jgi:hypothetical protein